MKREKKKTNTIDLMKNFIFRGGLSELMYQQVQPKSADENIGNMILLAHLSLIVSTLYIILSMAGIINQRLLWPYLILFIASFLISLISRKAKALNTHKKFVLAYIIEMTAMIFATLLGTYFSSSETEAVTFCCLLVAFPFILVDVPVRYDLSVLASIILFSFMEVAFKSENPSTTSVDLMNAWSFGILSALINWMFVKAKYSQLMMQIMVNKEKDTDQLSGLLTKDALHVMLAGALENKQKGAVIILDLDHFKHANDTYGHLFGDEVIAYTGTIIRQHMRRQDICGRFGGDEFLIFLPGQDKKIAEVIAERLRRGFMENVNKLSHNDGTLSFSVGITQIHDGDTFDRLFARVDGALYLAKQKGRNCNMIADENESEDKKEDKKVLAKTA